MDNPALSPLLQEMLEEYLPFSSSNVDNVLPLLDLHLLCANSKNPFDFIFLGHHFQARFAQDGSRADLDNSVVIYEHLLKMFPGGSPDELQHLRERGLSLVRAAEPPTLTALIAVGEDLTLLLSCLHRLGQSLGGRFVRYGDPDDLDRSITICLATLALEERNDDRSSLYDRLSKSYQHRFQLLKQPSDIQTSIDCAQMANEMLPDDSMLKPRALSTLAKTYELRYIALHEPTDWDQCMSYHGLMDAVTPPDHPMKHQLLIDYAHALCAGAEFRRDKADLEKGISTYRRAFSHFPPSHMNKYIYLLDLSRVLQTHYAEHRELPFLDELITVLGRALSCIPQDDLHSRTTNLDSLGLAHSQRFDHCGEALDLHHAIEYWSSARNLTPDVVPSKPHILANLAHCYLRTAPPDFEQAVSILQQGLAAAANLPAAQRILQEAYGEVLRSRFRALGDTHDLQESIDMFRSLVDSTDKNDNERPRLLAALLKTLETELRAPRKGPPSELDWNRLISISQDIVDSIPDGHPQKPWRLYDLANYYLQLWFCSAETISDPTNPRIKANLTQSADASAFSRAISSFRTAATSEPNTPSIQLHAAFSWANLALITGDNYGAFDGYRLALDTLPRIAWLGNSITNRHKQLAYFKDVAREAAHSAIRVGEFATAVEWLEQSRAIVWGQMLNLRAPLDDLRLVDSTLADRLLTVFNMLDKLSGDENFASPGGGTPMAGISFTDTESYPTQNLREIAMQTHHRLAEESDLLIRRVQSLQIPGLENFLSPKKLTELSSAARDGPVVLINIYGLDCDALIVTPDSSSKGVVHVPLKGITMEMAEKMQLQLRRSLAAAHLRSRAGYPVDLRGDGKKTLPSILSSLWKLIVKPILAALSITICEHGDVPPRLWWCPTGPLAFLPIHAAGIYDTEERGHKVFEYVVSSYTPSLNVLRERSHVPLSGFQGLLAVSQPNTPHQSPIPKTRDEIAQIISIAASQADLSLDAEWLDDAEATVAAVLDGMAAHSWIHLACHANQDPSAPTRSAFKLADGDLSLTDIIRLPLPHADFAFLSACQTASGDVALAEEAVHLAAGMLLAGYRSVIATMWSVRDEDGPLVAEGVYGQLFNGSGFDGRGSALALHRAVETLREKVGADNFFSWVPFIHVGL